MESTHALHTDSCAHSATLGFHVLHTDLQVSALKLAPPATRGPLACLYGVMDGHGGDGASNFVSNHLHHLVCMHERGGKKERQTDRTRVADAMRTSVWNISAFCAAVAFSE